MSKKVKARELFLANPGISNGDFVKLLMDKLSMTLQGARTYSYNARASADAPVAKKAKATSKQSIAKTASKKIEKSVDEVAATKVKNLAKMKELTKKLKPMREQLDDAIRARTIDFDPQLAREEVQAILEGEGFVAKPGKTHD